MTNLNEASTFLDLLQIFESLGPWFPSPGLWCSWKRCRINRHNSYPPQSLALWMRWQKKGHRSYRGLSHVVANGKTSSFYGWAVFHCVCIPHLTHSSTDMWGFLLPIFVIINNAVVDTKVHVSFWNMVLGRIMLSEISQMKKDKHCSRFASYVEYKTKPEQMNKIKWNKDKPIDTEKRLVVTRRKGMREGEMGNEGQLYGDEWKLNFWWWVGSVYRSWNIMLYTEIY